MRSIKLVWKWEWKISESKRPEIPCREVRFFEKFHWWWYVCHVAGDARLVGNQSLRRSPTLSGASAGPTNIAKGEARSRAMRKTFTGTMGVVVLISEEFQKTLDSLSRQFDASTAFRICCPTRLPRRSPPN
jgi:hypothetical protein